MREKIQPYLVGENGPELFVPAVNGKIIPTDELGPAVTKGSSGKEWNTSLKTWFTKDEASDYTGLPKSTINRLIVDGNLPARGPIWDKRIHIDDLYKWFLSEKGTEKKIKKPISRAMGGQVKAPWARRIGRDWEKELERYNAEVTGLTGQPMSEQSMAAATYGLSQAELESQRQWIKDRQQMWLQKKQLEAQDKGGGIGGAIAGIGKIGGMALGLGSLIPGMQFLAPAAAILSSGGAALGSMTTPAASTPSSSSISDSTTLQANLPAIGGRSSFAGDYDVWSGNNQSLTEPINAVPQFGSEAFNWQEKPISESYVDLQGNNIPGGVQPAPLYAGTTLEMNVPSMFTETGLFERFGLPWRL